MSLPKQLTTQESEYELTPNQDDGVPLMFYYHDEWHRGYWANGHFFFEDMDGFIGEEDALAYIMLPDTV